jgi:hypothetical protein
VLVLKEAGLVYLANPKTATQAVRAMLAPHARAASFGMEARHMNAFGFHRNWRAKVEARLGRPVETVAVMREPRSHMESWFRYRQRAELAGHENSTAGLSFADFVRGRLAKEPPPFAQVGRQDRFLGFLDAGPPVVHIFDYTRLDLLVSFLSDRLGTDLVLQRRNESPAALDRLELPKGLEARYRKAHATEFAIYERVAEAGVLVTRV